MPTAVLPHGTIHYRCHGPDIASHPVVFVHGFLTDGSLWDSVAELLAERGVRCIAPDWPLGSHPEPMNADADLSPRGVAKLVLEFVEDLDLQGVTLVGNDSGGAIVQFVLDEQQKSGADSRVTGVVLTNCDAFEVFPPRRFKLLFAIGRHPLLTRMLLMPTRWRLVRHSGLGYGPLSTTPLDSATTRRWVGPALNQRAIRRDIARFARGVRPAELAEVSGRLSEFSGRARIVWGTDDKAFVLDLAKRLAAVFPDATIVEVPGAGTFVPFDAPDRLADEIAAVVGAPR